MKKMKKTVINTVIVFGLNLIFFLLPSALQAQIENDSEILETNLNDLFSIRLRQISENEYTDRNKETKYLSHKPYKVVTDIAKAKKMLKKRIKGVKREEASYDQLEVIYKGRFKKVLNVMWLGWNKENNNFIAYYPELGVLILEHEASGDYPVDLNDSANEHVGNPKYHATSPDRQFRINGYYPGGPIDGWEFFLEKWNTKKTKYEFVASLINIEEPFYYSFSYTNNWFWTSNNKVLFKYGLWEEDARYYEMELIENK